VAFEVPQGAGGQSTLTWNGKNSQGQLVSSGSYTVELIDQGPAGQSTIVTSKGFEVLDAPGSSGPPQVHIGPNPLGPNDRELVFAYGALPQGTEAAVKLYNLAGELVAQGIDAMGSGKIVLQTGHWSAGIYIAVFETREGGSLVSRQLLRMAVQR
jgi:hypothetical protein